MSCRTVEPPNRRTAEPPNVLFADSRPSCSGPVERLVRGMCALVVLCTVLFAPAVQAAYLDLAWDAPTTNADGTPLTDLAGYRVYFGTSAVTCFESPFQEVPSPTPTPAPGDGFTFRLTGLESGAAYFVRVSAVDTNGNESVCSNEVTGVPQDDQTPSGGGNCFIATAAYGSPLEPQVVLLRTFRDRYLMTNAAGRAFVRWYYRVSPPLAALIRQSPPLKILVRAMLWPLVGVTWLILHPGVGFTLMILSGKEQAGSF
jgi:hypothetical protein